MELNPADLLRATLNFIEPILSDKSKLSCFFKHFPFKKLTDLTIMDTECINLCSKLLKQLIAEELLYVEFTENLQEIIQFVCLTLSSFKHESTEVAAIMIELLSTLVVTLENVDTYLSPSKKIDFIKEPIYDALFNCTKSALFNHSCSELCVEIVDLLIAIQGPHLALNGSLHLYVCLLFERCREINAEQQMCELSKIFLETLYPVCDLDMFQPVCNWLNMECFKIIIEQTDIVILQNLLYCLTKFIWTKSSKTNLIIKNLKHILSKLCQLSNEPKLRRHINVLLYFILSNENNVQLDYKPEEICVTLKQLPCDYKEWPKSENNLFFNICSMLIEHDKTVWDKNELLDAMSQKLLTFETIPISTLKSILYIYPIISDDLNDTRSMQINDLLLELLVCRSSFLESLFTLHPAQFTWIMADGNKNLKKSMLDIWIRDYEDNSKLCSLIKLCQVESLLVDALLESDNTGISEKVISLLEGLMNQNVSEKIAFYLAETAANTNTRLFADLLKCNPGVPEESGERLLLCTLMISMVECSTEETYLCNICKYCMKLVESFKDDPRCIEQFCVLPMKIKLLLRIASDINTTDKTAIDILSLLIQLIRMQRKTKPHLRVSSVEEKLTGLLQGSPEKILKALQLLQYVIISKRELFIKIKLCSMLDTYYMLLDLSEKSILSGGALCCLCLLIKRENWLALTELSLIYVEVRCLTTEECDPNFLHFLEAWMRVMNSNRCHELYNDFPIKMVETFILKRGIQGAICGVQDSNNL